MKTIQGKEFSYNDVLLFHISDMKVNLLVNDEEQMDIYKNTGNLNDLPISILDYNKTIKKNLVTNMKQIREYSCVGNNVIVKYNDGTKFEFDINNLGYIENIFNGQKIQKEVNRKNKRNAAIACILASTCIVTGSLGYLIGSKKLKEINDINSEFVFGGTYKAQANHMYEKLKDTAFAQKINWTKELAESIVEYANGEYPREMENMNEEDALKKQEEIENAIQTLISYNLSVSSDKVVNIADYVISNKEKNLINDALVMGRCLSVGDTTGKILSSCDWTTHAILSGDKNEAINNFINYEYDTMYNSTYAELPSSVRFVIASTYEMSNEYIPGYSHVTRERSESDVRENELYFRYFVNENTYETFLPRKTETGDIEYVLTYSDCSEKVYDETTMYVLAGKLINKNYEYGYIEQIPGIKQCGVENEVNYRVDEAMEQMRDNINIMARSNQLKKKK